MSSANKKTLTKDEQSSREFINKMKKIGLR